MTAQRNADVDTGAPLDDTPVEELANTASRALAALGEVLGRDRMTQWLDEVRHTLAVSREPKPPGEPAEMAVARWVKDDLGASSTALHYEVPGQMSDLPYEVSVWARFNGNGTGACLDMWIECRTDRTSIRSRDIVRFVRKAIDVFYFARADRRAFWFDRLMLVSRAPFDPSAVAMADRYGVACVRQHDAGYSVETRRDWKANPRWLKDAEAALEKLQG